MKNSHHRKSRALRRCNILSAVGWSSIAAHSRPYAGHLLVKNGHGNGKRLKGTYRVKVNGKSIVFHLANLLTHQHSKYTRVVKTVITKTKNDMEPYL